MKTICKRTVCLILTLLLCVQFLILPSFGTTFSDVAYSHWAYYEIDYMTEYGFMEGSGNYFYPSSNFTRGEAALTLAKIFGIDVSNNNVSTGFSDVASGSKYAAAVKWAADYGIFAGDGAGFKPNDAITRQQFCVVLCSFFDAFDYEMKNIKSYAQFTDEDQISSWAKESVRRMYCAGLIEGTASNQFSPKSNLTKAMGAVLLYNIYVFHIFDRYYTPSLADKVWCIKNDGESMRVTSSAGYHGYNDDNQRLTFAAANYTDPAGDVGQVITWDYRNAMKFRIVEEYDYEDDVSVYSIRPICSYNGYYRQLSVNNNNYNTFAPGQNIYTSSFKSNSDLRGFRFVFKILDGSNYTIHLANNRRWVLERTSTGVVLADYESGNADQIFSIEAISGRNGDTYQNYNSMESYYKAKNWRWPLNNNKPLTSSYGYRTINNGPDQFHQGIDVSANVGDDLYAVADGTVVGKGNRNPFGEYVVIETNATVYNDTEKIKVVYQHLNQESPLNEGDNVNKYTIVGEAGATGNVTGAHLHMTVIPVDIEYTYLYEMLFSAVYIDKTINPLLFYDVNDLIF